MIKLFTCVSFSILNKTKQVKKRKKNIKIRYHVLIEPFSCESTVFVFSVSNVDAECLTAVDWCDCWWLLWRDKKLCWIHWVCWWGGWCWAEWWCKLLLFAEPEILSSNGCIGWIPCDLVIVNSPFDVVILWIWWNKEQTSSTEKLENWIIRKYPHKQTLHSNFWINLLIKWALNLLSQWLLVKNSKITESKLFVRLPI